MYVWIGMVRLVRDMKEAIKERIKVDLEKLKMAVTIIVLLAGGLVGLLYKNLREPLTLILFIGGLVMEMILIWYVSKVNAEITDNLEKLEVQHD